MKTVDVQRLPMAVGVDADGDGQALTMRLPSRTAGWVLDRASQEAGTKGLDTGIDAVGPISETWGLSVTTIGDLKLAIDTGG